MDYLLKVVALLVTAFAIVIHLLTRAKKSCPANLPPGSLGLPVIGQTLGILRAMHVNSVDHWFGDRIGRYGPVSKFSLFGKPTVLLAGPAANKLMFFNSLLPPYVPLFSQRIIGEKNILSLYGDDHRRIRGALMEFLKPDMLKLYVNRIDAEVRHHLEENWAGRTTVTVLPLMKRLTFNIISALVFGLEASAVRDAFAHDTEKPRYEKPSRAAAIAKPRSGGQKSLFRTPPGNCPEGISIDITAIFIAAMMRRE
ncbi:hypothetical protein QYE76_005682 [Lolium multiflorum]|uniref:Uncharacterized protein n=1 Tax=Lolium multiflorum TaxID=4521 RepID=A0AAD8W1E3_LOLMU|nr:hypothetical protein QYE76_005682 [Lolium multiflorum]